MTITTRATTAIGVTNKNATLTNAELDANFVDIAAKLATISGTNTGDNATNSQYSADYRAGNFVAGTNYVAPGGALGTPSSGVATNLTGTASGLTSGITNGLKTATTTVAVSSATAPTAGQVLTATGPSAATWQDPSGGGLAVVVVSGTTQTAVKNAHYLLANVAATTVTLPASPASGDTVWVTWANSLVTNVIARNGQTIMGLSENMSLDSLINGTVQLRFLNSSWRIL